MSGSLPASTCLHRSLVRERQRRWAGYVGGVNLYIAEINRCGGVDGRKVNVLAYDDQNNKDIARERAREVARDSNALVVIGYYYRSISLEGGKIYKRYGIPAVTASATAPKVTEYNEWYNSAAAQSNRSSMKSIG